ncbi:putative SAP1-member of the AAA-protein family [Apiospora rasikravindrae]|uniref:SAP1-member of the AAA-protein family n=1 Tax=Apiospora rasikravindrae TaxID=990691 RepID=A0ABR1TE43_9PEZI
MWANKAVSNLQKTYDESYLTCSTAVYYESQGNEKEAMRYWKTALDQINHNSPNKPSYTPKSETERALLESLKTLETQCKERVDLLEALRISREEDVATKRNSSSSGTNGGGSSSADPSERGWIGGGTIPAISYTELSRPSLPPRPSMTVRNSSERAVVGQKDGTSVEQSSPSSSAKQRPPLPPYASSTTPRKKSSRSPSPDKRTMRTTLRSGRSSEKAAKASPRMTPKSAERPGASKAATLAWSNISSRENLGKVSSSDLHSPAAALSEPRRSSEQTRKASASAYSQWDSHTRRLVATPDDGVLDPLSPGSPLTRHTEDYTFPGPSSLALGAASSALGSLAIGERAESAFSRSARGTKPHNGSMAAQNAARASTNAGADAAPASGRSSTEPPFRRKPVAHRHFPSQPNSAKKRTPPPRCDKKSGHASTSEDDEEYVCDARRKEPESPVPADLTVNSPDVSGEEKEDKAKSEWERKKKATLKRLPPGVDSAAAKAIFNEIVVEGDEVHWSDVAGLEIAKSALREAVVYPFLRPDLFMGLREPARGMLLFGPPGTGKTMLARAVATESKSTFFSISASSLTSKYLGESEKLVRALFALAKAMSPSIIFVDEIDSLLSQRSGSGEHEATQRIKTEFLIQWSDLQRAAAGRESSPGGKGESRGDANRVLVLAATNLPWAIDDAARRRFVRRQYIPLPEPETRATQLRTLLGQQKHSLTEVDILELVELTDGFSGSDITALAKDAAMGPLRSLGEALLHMTMDQIRPIELADFKASLRMIRPSVSPEGLKEYEDWAKQFGERGG